MPKELSDEQVRERVREIVSSHDFCRDEYAQWATAIVTDYNDLLSDMGCRGLRVICQFPSDHFCDSLAVVDVYGECEPVPDPENDAAKFDTSPVEAFFVRLNNLKPEPIPIVRLK